MFSELIDERFLLRSEDFLGLFDFPSLFGRSCPVEIEIGTGKGRFILAEAFRRPQVGFLGIERAWKYLQIALARLNRSGCENVRLLCEDAGSVVRRLIPDDSVSTYHIYFPDPWPKRRHHKRRLIKPDFVGHLCRTLIPGGTLKIATDHPDYFQQIIEALDSVGNWAKTHIRTERARGAHAPDATHFEVKYSRQECNVFWITYVTAPEELKRDSPTDLNSQRSLR